MNGDNHNNDAQAWWLDLLSHTLEEQNTASVPSIKRAPLRVVGSPVLPSIQESTEKNSKSSPPTVPSLSAAQAEFDANSSMMNRFPPTDVSTCSTSGVTSTVTTPVDELLDGMNQQYYHNSLERMMLHDKVTTNATSPSTFYKATYFWPRNAVSRTTFADDTLTEMSKTVVPSSSLVDQHLYSSSAYHWRQQAELNGTRKPYNTMPTNGNIQMPSTTTGASSPLQANHTLTSVYSEGDVGVSTLSNRNSSTVKAYNKELQIVSSEGISMPKTGLPSPMHLSTCTQDAQFSLNSLAAQKHEIRSFGKGKIRRSNHMIID
jgi:hypothetical protein